MACACGSKTNSTRKWLHTNPSGVKTVYDSEQDARMAASREGGTVRAQ